VKTKGDFKMKTWKDVADYITFIRATNDHLLREEQTRVAMQVDESEDRDTDPGVKLALVNLEMKFRGID